MAPNTAQPDSETIPERIRAQEDTLTRAERQLVAAITANYPVSGLGSITRLAEAADVSTPTVVRLVQKLGFTGFPEFQDAIRGELEARISDPIAKHESWASGAPEGHILNRFTDKVTENIRQTLANIDADAFDAAAALLADEARTIFVTGGRLTHALSEYLHLHAQVMRPGVRHIRSTANAWPHDLLDLRPGDVLVIYDIRRYENASLKLAEMARDRGAVIVLITDQWQSPIAAHATHTFPCRIEAPSAWDSAVSILLLTETLIAAAQEKNWKGTAARMRDLEQIFDRSRTFRKFT